MNIVKSLLTAIMAFCIYGNAVYARSVSLEEASIPTLDMNEFYNSNTRGAFVEKMSRAMQELGFFAVVNTGISTQILDDAYDATKTLFTLPMDVKMRYDGRPVNCQRGFTPPNVEVARNSSKTDFKEMWHFGPNISPERAQELGYPADMWPTEIHFKEPMMALFNMLSEYVVSLEEAFALAIGEEANIFSDMTKEGASMMRLAYYLPCSDAEKKNTVWAGEHTDIDLFAILPRATASGLEVQTREGEWIRVVVPDDAFIVNCGDMLENMTNGYFRSAVHRVIATEENGNEGRYSMILFVHPKDTDDLSPLPSCIAKTGGVQTFANATRWELLSERLVAIGYAAPHLFKQLQDCGLIERLIQYNRASLNTLRSLKAHGCASELALQKLEELEQGQL